MPDQLPPPPHASGAEPEYLGPAAAVEDGAPRAGHRWGVVAGAAAAVVATAGVGAWGVAQLMAGGDDPASAVPALAVAYLSVDLDPSAAQKIDAISTLKKFPGLAEQLDLDARDDLRRWVFEELQSTETCTDLDYERDIEPWLGDRMAVAAVPDDDAPLAPMLVVQVKDRDAARAGVAALDKCTSEGTASMPGSTSRELLGKSADEKPAGVAFVGDYMLLTEHQDDADALATAAEAAPLADDPTFQEWTGRVGEPGVVTAYASADAPRLMLEAQQKVAQDEGWFAYGPGEQPPMSAPGELGGLGEKTRALWQDFEGMAAVVRFADGAIEAEMAAGGLPHGVGTTAERTGPSLADLPAGTAAALTVSLADGWLSDQLDSMAQMLSAGGSADEFWAQAEAETGLQLPEDIEAMLGDGFSVSVDASADFDELTSSPDVPEVPVGVRINGDPAEITDALDKLLAQLGPGAEGILVESGEDFVVVGLDPAYVDRLLAGGGLGDQESLADVVPEADRAAGAFYVDFDAGDGWAERLAEGDKELAENIAPLDALGISAWSEDGNVQHGLFKLTTD